MATSLSRDSAVGPPQSTSEGEAIGKQEYSYRLDKKQCPNGAVQSYVSCVDVLVRAGRQDVMFLTDIRAPGRRVWMLS